MLFPNIRRILKMGSPLSSWKLMLAVGMTSRPRYRGLFLRLLQPFAHNGEITIRYRCYERWYTTLLRMSDLEADSVSTLELGVSDIYLLDRNYNPDLVIDGGGNIGLFTLRAAASALPGTKSPTVVVCEPLPRNIDQIHKHLKMNGVEAEVMPSCLGGTRGAIPFYCRAANQSSFDPHEAYEGVMEVPVVLLEDALGNNPAQRILIKLDIEGMEVEALSALLPKEGRAVYVVGELHNASVNVPRMRQLFRDNGWTLDLFDVGDETGPFRACSPAAASLLAWTTAVKEPAFERDGAEIR